MARKILLEHANIPGIKTYDVYRQHGGYRSVEKALKSMTPDEIVEENFGLKGSWRRRFPNRYEMEFYRQEIR